LSGLRSRWTMPLRCAAAEHHRDLPRDGDRLGERPAATRGRSRCRQALPLEELHDDVGGAVARWPKSIGRRRCPGA
jgi:hypothetical protein